MFPSSKASGEGMGFLNQSICPGGIKSLFRSCTGRFDQEGEISLMRGKVLDDGSHSKGIQGYSVPLSYLCRSGKCEITRDLGRWQGELSMGKCYCPQVVRI